MIRPIEELADDWRRLDDRVPMRLGSGSLKSIPWANEVQIFEDAR
jgi:hypothetical protein